MHTYQASVRAQVKGRSQVIKRGSGLERAGGALVAMGSVGISQHSIRSESDQKPKMNPVLSHGTQSLSSHSTASSTLHPTREAKANYFALQNSLRITPHTARNWMLGISMPRQEHLRVLATWLKVSPDQLRFGRSEANTTIFRGYEVSIEDQEFLAKYFSLSTAQKSIVRSVANYPF